MFYNYADQLSYYEGANSTWQNCKYNKTSLFPPPQDPTYNAVKGLKDFVAGNLKTKEGGSVTIIAAGGRFGSGERNISISRHVWLVNNFSTDPTDRKNKLIQKDFNFHRHSMQPVVIDTNFFQGMECVERNGGGKKAPAPPS